MCVDRSCWGGAGRAMGRERRATPLHEDEAKEAKDWHEFVGLEHV